MSVNQALDTETDVFPLGSDPTSFVVRYPSQICTAARDRASRASYIRMEVTIWVIARPVRPYRRQLQGTAGVQRNGQAAARIELIACSLWAQVDECGRDNPESGATDSCQSTGIFSSTERVSVKDILTACYAYQHRSYSHESSISVPAKQFNSGS